MPNRLFLRPENNAIDEMGEICFDWCLYDVTANYVSSGTGNCVEEISQLLARNSVSDYEIVILIPANQVFVSRVTLPGKQKRFIQQALPYAIEEQLCQDLENFHLAHTPTSKNDVEVVAVLHEEMKRLIECISVLGHSLQGIYVDASLLPVVDSDVCICLESNYALVHTQDGYAMRLQKHELATWLDLYLTENDAQSTDKQCQLFLTVSQKSHEQIICAELQQLSGLVIKEELLQVEPLQLWCELWLRQRGQLINLCQDVYKQGRNESGPLKIWKPAAIAASLFIFCLIGANLIEGNYYHQKSDAVMSSALTAYKQLNPGARRTNAANLNRQLKGELKNAQPSGELRGFVDLLAKTGEQYGSQFTREITITAVSYSDKRSELIVELEATGFDALESFKQSLNGKGLKVEVNTAVKESKFLRGRISISA